MRLSLLAGLLLLAAIPAHAQRPGQQPGMVRPPAPCGLQQRQGGAVLAEEIGVGTRLRRRTHASRSWPNLSRIAASAVSSTA